jgi:endonuclease YncB( thermonuclease family)
MEKRRFATWGESSDVAGHDPPATNVLAAEREKGLDRDNPSCPVPVELTTVPKTYAELLRAVQRVLFTGQREIEIAWVRTYHETGRLIQEHILLNKDRADYGAKVYRRLARDTGASERKLYECAQFYRRIPILRSGAKFNWASYRVLCQVAEPAQRLALMKEAEKAGWNAVQIIERVRALNATLDVASTSAPAQPASDLLTPKRGIVRRYRVLAQEDGFGPAGADGLCVDLGFKLYLPLSPAQSRYRAAGEIVRVDAEGVVWAVADGKPTDLFTYEVAVRRVIDGDTLEIGVALPHLTLRVKLRLRGLDCPEIATPEGKVAKRVVEALVRDAQSVTIYSSKPDKYDRYLADVFFKRGDGTEIFLNNHLLENGHAERKDAWEFGDWEKLAER